MFRSIVALFSLVVLLGTSYPVLAQELEQILPVPIDESMEFVGSIQCFDYYQFGSVQADLQSDLTQTVPGADITFTGKITNANDYPLVDGTFYVKIFRRDEATFTESDGNPVVDQFVVSENITIPGRGSIPQSYTWKVPMNAEGGEYYAASFFITSDRYNLLGLSFTDDVVGNTASFGITNETDQKNVALSKTATTLNGQNHSFASFPLSFSATDTVTISTTVTNPSDQSKTVPLQWNQFSWDGMNPDNRINTKTEVVKLEPNETREVTYTVKEQRGSVVFVTATIQDKETKNILNIRYVRDGVEETRINFPSITKFPLTAGEEQMFFACAHSTNVLLVEGNTLTLILRDKNGDTIHQYVYEGAIADAMSGFGETFTPTRNYNQATLTATLKRQGVIIEEVKVSYDCNEIDPSSCLPEPEEEQSLFDSIMSNPLFLFGGVVVLLLLLALVWLVHRRHNVGPNINVMNTRPPMALLFLLVLPALFFAQVGEIEAKGLTFSHQVAQYVSGCSQMPCFAQMYTYYANITYTLDAYYSGTAIKIPENSTVSVGTSVEFRQNFLAEHNTWYYTGASLDTPYGVWTSSIASFTPSLGRELGVQYPNVTYGHGASTASLSCTNAGKNCVVNTAGTISTIAYYSGALYKFTGSHSIYSPAATGAGNLPAQQLTYVINVVAGNAPPQVPVITGASDSGPNVIENFSFISDDPNGDTLRYGIDWDNNSVVDQWVPTPPSFVNSGTSRNANWSWSSTGSYTFQVLAEDSNGERSGWGSHTITISNNCVVPSGATTPDGTEDELIDSCAFSAGGSGYARPGFFTSAYVIYEDPLQNPYVPTTNPGYRVCHNSSNPYAFPMGCTTGGGAGMFVPQASCTPPNVQCNFNPAATANLTINASDGPLTVSKHDTLTVTWTSTNAASCMLYGAGMPNGTVATNGTISVSASAITSSPESYVLSCNGATDSVSVTAQNQAPNAPAITGPTSAEGGDSNGFTITGTDPDGDQIFYEIDWDNNGTVDVSTPASGYVSSGTGLPASRSWNNAGSYTFSARTVDFDNARSGWTQHTIIIDSPPLQTPGCNFVEVQTCASGSCEFGTSASNGDSASQVQVSTLYTLSINGVTNSYGATCSTNYQYSTPTRFERCTQSVPYVVDGYRFTVKVDGWGHQGSNRAYGSITECLPPPTASLEYSINNGTWSSEPTLTTSAEDIVTLRWSSTNAASCAGTGDGFSTGNNTSGTDQVTTPSAGNNSSFTINCNGATDTINVTSAKANLSNINVTANPSVTYDPTTGVYDSVTVTFNTQNTGQSGIGANPQYVMRFDRSNNGFDQTTSPATIGVLSVSQTSANLSQTFSNVPFGAFTAEVTVDSQNQVDESNEGDNIGLYTQTLAPPDPGLTISVDRAQVRPSDTVTVSWSATDTYPMNCTVRGPAGVNETDNTAPYSGSKVTGPITAKSTFTFSCTEPTTNTTWTKDAIVETVGTLEEV